MSIPNDYRNLADKVAGFAHRNEAIPPRTAASLAMELLKLADLATRMERLRRGPRAVAGLRRCRVTSHTAQPSSVP